MSLAEIFAVAKPVIGMLHLPPLPGSPQNDGSPASIRAKLLADAKALVGSGVDGLMLENFGDTPFYPGRVPAAVVAWMTVLGAEIRARFDRPLGVNVLRNDAVSALAVAHASGAAFIRVNVLCGARLTDQGLVQGCAHRLLRLRKSWGATSIQIWGDVAVKHSAPLAVRPLVEETNDLLDRGGADAVIVSGTATGMPTDCDDLRAVKQAADSKPVLVGSGVTAGNLAQVFADADGFIVGTAFKIDGRACQGVDEARVRQFMQTVARLRGQPAAGPQRDDA